MKKDKSWVHYLCFDAYFEDALMKMRSATGLGATYALFTALNQYFYEHGYLDEKGFQYHKEKYGLPLVEEFEHRLNLENEAKNLAIRHKELELKRMNAKPRPDYSKLTIEELQKQYNLAKTRGDSTGVQLMAFEFKKRGIAKEVG